MKNLRRASGNQKKVCLLGYRIIKKKIRGDSRLLHSNVHTVHICKLLLGHKYLLALFQIPQSHTELQLYSRSVSPLASECEPSGLLENGIEENLHRFTLNIRFLMASFHLHHSTSKLGISLKTLTGQRQQKTKERKMDIETGLQIESAGGRQGGREGGGDKEAEIKRWG